MIAWCVIVFAFIEANANNTDYCKIKCGGNSHTMCVFKSDKPSSRCIGFVSQGLTVEEKKKVLNVHNRYRQRVATGQEKRGKPGPQPAAENMHDLEWDDELELIAQRWANQCESGRDKCRNIERFTVGQNVATFLSVGNLISMNEERMVEGWYDEVKDFSEIDVSEFRPGNQNYFMKIGEYTQLVWAKTYKVGCGKIKYKEGIFNKKVMICNYGPSGDVIGQPVYEKCLHKCVKSNHSLTSISPNSQKIQINISKNIPKRIYGKQIKKSHLRSNKNETSSSQLKESPSTNTTDVSVKNKKNFKRILGKQIKSSHFRTNKNETNNPSG